MGSLLLLVSLLSTSSFWFFSLSLSLSLNSFLVPTPLFCRILQPKREGDDASVGESEPGRLAVVEHEGSGAVALGVLDLELGLALDQR